MTLSIMNKQPFSLIRYVLFTLVTLLLALPSSHTHASQIKEKVTIQLSWRYQFEFAPIIAALEKGYYQAAGLKVTIVEGGPKVNPIQQVTHGKAEYGIFSSALVVSYGKGVPVVALAALMQHSAVALIAKQSKINSVFDLANKPIAASPDTRAEIIAYLRSAGLKNASIRITPKTKYGLANLDTFCAVSGYISNEGFFWHKEPKKYFLMSPRAAGIDLFGNILFTSQRQLQTHPTQVKKFRSATLKGLQYALTHRDEMVELIYRKYNSQKKTKEHLQYEAKTMWDLTRPDIVEPGYMSMGRWKHVAEVYASLKSLPKNVKLEPFIYNPNPRPDLRWLYLSLMSTLVVLSLVSIALWHNKRITRQLLQQIQERRQAEAALKLSESRFQDLFNNNPDPCWLLENNRIVECNIAAAIALGYAGKELLVNQQITVFARTKGVVSSQETALSALLSQIKAKESMRFDWYFKKSDGEEIPVEITLAHYVVADKERLYCVWRDITERKEVDKMKDEFISVVSHELRTPLTSIVGSLGLLNGGSLGDIPQKASPLIDIAYKNSMQLRSLINDILDLSKIEAGGLEYDMVPLSVSSLLEQSVTNNEPYAKEYGCQFALHPTDKTLMIQGDESKLLQVMNNLLSNAIKFSPSGSCVDLRAVRLEEKIHIHIRDYGDGIPEEFQPKLFNKFSQVDSTNTRRTGGSGLGLSISKAIIEVHQGKITYHTEKGKGTTFTVVLNALA